MQARGIEIFDRSHPLAPAVLGAVAAGGFVGAAGRWFVTWGVDYVGSPHVPGTWPWATLIVNVVGSALIGLMARRYAERDTVAWAFTVTGVLGGFTTFSALAVELNDLLDAERAVLAAAYALATMIGGVLAVLLAGPRQPIGDTMTPPPTTPADGGVNNRHAP